MKKISIAMAAIAASFTMASCNKEALVEQEENTASGNCIITASTEIALTKTYLDGNDTDGYDVVWSAGDSLAIGTETFSLTDGVGTTSGVFEGTVPADGNYTVYYPFTYNGTDWPAAQTYVEGNITGSPMKAEVTVSGGNAPESIRFYNEGGILRLTVSNTTGVKIKNIIVMADGLKPIILNCTNDGNGVTLSNTGTVFHIAMPSGVYSNTKIWLTDFDDKVCIKTLKNKDLVITRSQITPAGFTASEFNTHDIMSCSPAGAIGMVDGREGIVVDLGGSVGSIVVATMNICSTEAPEEGIDESLGTYLSYDEVVAAINAGIWGEGWYLPSYAEYSALMGRASWSNSDETYGCVISFPANGTDLYLAPLGMIGTMGKLFDCWEQGYYWTSTPYSGTTGPCSYTFCFVEGHIGFMVTGHDALCTVRLFHKMPEE